MSHLAGKLRTPVGVQGKRLLTKSPKSLTNGTCFGEPRSFSSTVHRHTFLCSNFILFFPFASTAMTVLRSREILPTNPKTEPAKNGATIEPATPSPTREAASLQDPDSGSICRRSARLASKSSVSSDDDPTSGQYNVKRKRKLDVGDALLSSEVVKSDRFLNLRSGRKVVKRRIENDGDESFNVREMEGKEKGEGREKFVEKGVELEFEAENDKKGKRVLRGVSEKGVDVVVMENLGTDRSQSGNASGSENGRMRFSREEKGKTKLVDEDLVPSGGDVVKLGLENKVNGSVDATVWDAKRSEESVVRKTNDRANETRMEQFRDIARMNASRFAFFSSREEVPIENEREMPVGEVDQEIEDWPGPFSTAMKIIRDREDKLNRQHGCYSVEKKAAPITWIPKKVQGQVHDRSKLIVPSLKELCLKILVQNADAITSLGHVPDALRHKLSLMLCDSRGMNSHFLDLLLTGSPTEIRLRDCSWLTEEQFIKSFEGCDTCNLTVLQLDRCGRCMPDYIVLSTLASSSNNLPSLTTLSLCGACRLSDVGLQALVSSAPALRYINLSQCSLLTPASIDILAYSLGSVIQELYINDCQNIDAMLILPSLKKLKCLEVLSVAGIETVTDNFIREFIDAHGHNMKELVLADCVKLTDVSFKVIAETCQGLCALDISNLCKLTDFAIGYLANGCRAIQKLKLCRNAFSDEAVAAFLEASGEPLKELSLNNVKKVAHNTAVSLAKRCRNLLSLDLSWCRNLTNEAVGLIVDSCLSLRILKLFGCTQITNVFLDGHSNPEVQVVGLKMSSVLEHLKTPDYEEVPLHYSSVLSLM